MPTLYVANTVYTNALFTTNAWGFFAGPSGGTNSNRLGHTSALSGITPVLNIYGGSMPADFTEFTDITERAGDLLIKFTLPVNVNYIDLGNADGVSRRVIIGRHPANQAATASGTATWFLITQTSTTVTGLNDKASLMGTVGLPGSGADLVIPNTNIISGVNYQSSGLVVNFPYGFNI